MINEIFLQFGREMKTYKKKYSKSGRCLYVCMLIFFSSFYFVKFRVFFIVDLIVIVLVCIAFISWAIQAFLEIVCSLGRGSRYGRAPRTDAKSCPLAGYTACTTTAASV